MDLDASVVWALTTPGILDRAKAMSLDPSDLSEAKFQRAFKFIAEHAESYGEIPASTLVSDVCRVEIPDPEVNIDFILEQALKRKLFLSVRGAVKQAEELLRQNDPERALTELQTFLSRGGFSVNSVDPSSLFSLANGVIASYRTLLKGEMGIEFPWPSMSEITMGLWPGTATYFVARPGIGKTQVAILVAHCAWHKGKKVLVISPEMSKEEVAERYFLYESGVSGVRAIRGTLSSFEVTKLEECIEGAKDNTGAWVIDSSDKLTVPYMEAAIDAVKPDLVAVDSIYMLPFRGDKAERTERAVDWIRFCSKSKNLPFVCFHQMNRTTVKDKKFGGGYDTSNIALSDQLLWDAHGVFLMEQDKDMKADRLMRFHVGKMRRGQWDGEPIDCHWDFDTMNFDEVKKVSVASTFDKDDEDDEFTAYDTLFGED